MSFWICLAILTIVGLVSCFLMKKIQPEWFKWYKWYALAIWLLWLVINVLPLCGG